MLFKKKHLHLFEKNNNNPIKRETDDCAIRAISRALVLDWVTVYDGFCKLARKFKCLPGMTIVTNAYLENRGLEKTTSSGKQTLGRFAKFSDGNFIVLLSYDGGVGHLVYVTYGIVIDAWDCRDKKVLAYWEV